MRALILNSTDSEGKPELLNRSGDLIERELKERGWTVTKLNLSEKNITPCCGRFKCWVQTPGECAIKDDQSEVIQHIIKSDILIYLTRVTFGGYSSQLKKALDRMIPILLPFFMKVEGEIHHPQRYPNKRKIFVLGSQKEPNTETEKIFHDLIRRNALNMDIQDINTIVVPESINEKELSVKIKELLNSKRGIPMNSSKILLLVGSPRKARSTSHSIGKFLLSRLEEKGWDTGTLFIHDHIHTPEKMVSAIQSIQTANVILLAFPLYVDQLPAPVIQLLELMDTHYKENPSSEKQKLMTVINCGFPETFQNQPASDIMKQFSDHMNMTWLGSLNLGMGGFIGGKSLHEAGGPARSLIKKLETIIPYLDKGESLPEGIVKNFGKPLMPRWLYTFAGNLGWKKQTKKNGVNPYARPYDIQ